MARFVIRPISQVSYDRELRDVVRSYFDPGGVPTEGKLKLDTVAEQFLVDNRDRLRFDPKQLVQRESRAAGAVRSVRFEQTARGVPVYGAWVVVNVHEGEHRVLGFTNNYFYSIPEDFEATPKIGIESVARILEERRDELRRQLSKANPKTQIRTEIGKPQLYVYIHPSGGRSVEDAEGRKPQRVTALRPDPKGVQVFRLVPTERPEPGRVYLVWRVLVDVLGTARANAEIVVNAQTGGILLARDRSRYVDGTGNVWGSAGAVAADPVRLTGDTTLTTNTKGTIAPALTFDPLVREEVLRELDPADASGNYGLTGPFCRIAEIEDPVHAPPSESVPAFPYDPANSDFLAVMVYFWIHQAQRFIQDELQIANAAAYQIPADPRGKYSKLNAHFIPGSTPATGKIGYGDGESQEVPSGNDPAPPTASDAAVILHEYSHAIQDAQGYPDYSDADDLWEGFADIFPHVFLDRWNPAGVAREQVFPWLNNAACGYPAGEYRRVNLTQAYPSADPDLWNSWGAYFKGDVWATTAWQIFLALGGASGYDAKRQWAANLLLRLYLQANQVFSLTPGPPPYVNHRNMALALETASRGLGGWAGIADGLFHKVIRDRCIQRGLFDPLSVDVYIDDGRDGGYDYLEDFWNCQEIVVRRTATDTPATPGFGHEDPIVDQPNYLWVRVKKRGQASAGAVNVRAFSCSPGTGLVWPSHWTASDPPAMAVADLDTVGVTWVGPFKFTPTEVGHSCVLAIVEAENDPANTEGLTGEVAHWMLVPFDNNIAQRNINPVPAMGGSWRRFRLLNYRDRSARVTLDVEHDLPDGWRLHWDVPDARRISIPPFGEKWVTLRVDVPSGRGFTDLKQRTRVSVRAIVDGIPDGGMTFEFVHPDHPSVRPAGQRKPDGLDPACCCPCLEGFLKGSAIEGEIKIEVRFKRP